MGGPVLQLWESFLHFHKHACLYAIHNIFNHLNVFTFFLDSRNPGFSIYHVVLWLLNFPYQSVFPHCIEIAHLFLSPTLHGTVKTVSVLFASVDPGPSIVPVIPLAQTFNVEFIFCYLKGFQKLGCLRNFSDQRLALKIKGRDRNARG